MAQCADGCNRDARSGDRRALLADWFWGEISRAGAASAIDGLDVRHRCALADRLGLGDDACATIGSASAAAASATNSALPYGLRDNRLRDCDRLFDDFGRLRHTGAANSAGTNAGDS